MLYSPLSQGIRCAYGRVSQHSSILPMLVGLPFMAGASIAYGQQQIPAIPNSSITAMQALSTEHTNSNGVVDAANTPMPVANRAISSIQADAKINTNNHAGTHNTVRKLDDSIERTAETTPNKQRMTNAGLPLANTPLADASLVDKSASSAEIQETAAIDTGNTSRFINKDISDTDISNTATKIGNEAAIVINTKSSNNEPSASQQRSLNKLMQFYLPRSSTAAQNANRFEANAADSDVGRLRLADPQHPSTPHAAVIRDNAANTAIVNDNTAFHNPSPAIDPVNKNNLISIAEQGNDIDTVNIENTSTSLISSTGIPNNTDLKNVESIQTIQANQIAPVALPKVYNNPDYDNDTAAERCEGVWVTPAQTNAATGAYANQAMAGLHALADYGYYDNETYVELAGNVAVRQNGQLIEADQLILDLQRGVAGASGGVLLADSMPTHSAALTQSGSELASGSGLIVAAENIAYNTQNRAATAYDVAFASVAMQAHGYAQRLNKPTDSRYELDDVMFSTCPPTNRKWQLNAKQIDIDTDTGRGEAYNATFKLGNVPVFYLPYFNFPIDDRRASGLLTPSASIDTDTGLKVSLPYYLNLAPNYDATITTDIYTSRNPMLTTELRYLTERVGQGELTASYLPNDSEYNDDDRRGLFYVHQWQPQDIPNLSAEVVYNYVSDPEYLNDFDDYGLNNNPLNLPRRAQVNYYNDYLTTEFKVETFQSLRAIDSEGNEVLDKDKPYSRLPQLSVDYRLPTLSRLFDGINSNDFLNNVLITGQHDSAYFKKSITDGSENERSGARLFNTLSASYSIEKTWGYITPEASLQHLYTAYDEESRLDNNITKEDSEQSVFVPQLSVDAGLNFYQAGAPFGWFNDTLGGYQLLTPRVKYVYAPYRNQRGIPNFNTRIASLDYNQLFADNWFLGHDRLPDSNNLALGVNYRYIDAMGVTRFDGSIGDQFFFDDISVSLEGMEKTYTKDSAGIAWNSSIQPFRNLWFDLDSALDSNNELNFISSQVRYQPTPHSLLNLGYIKRLEDEDTNQDALSAITASAIIPVTSNWRLLSQGQYDMDNARFVDATVGVDYEDCCYGFSVYGRRYYNDLNLDDSPTQAVMAEFRINGLGDNIGRLSKILSNKILGFEPVDALWKR